MIELHFADFHDQNYEDNGFCLYVTKNGLDDILYIGISTVDVWVRWFGWGGHVTLGRSGILWRIVHWRENRKSSARLTELAHSIMDTRRLR